MKTIIFDLNYLGDSSQEQLDAYRKLGSIRHFKRLRQQELRRKRLLKRTWWLLKNLFFGACVAFDLWIFISLMDVIANNLSKNAVHQAWNFFVLLF